MSKVLGFDPGAFRMGWCVLEKGEDTGSAPKLVGSGVFGLERGSNGSKKEEYQKYRLRLIEFWIEQATYLYRAYKPELVVNEIVPVVGGGNFVLATQGQLAATAITTAQAVALQQKIRVEQIGATTIKKRIGGKKNATKVGVRNGVYAIMPETKRFHSEWTKVFDCSDAFAIALTHLGYKHG